MINDRSNGMLIFSYIFSYICSYVSCGEAYMSESKNKRKS